MKICFITDAWMPVWGGGQEHVLQVSKVLREKYGQEVEIIAPKKTDLSLFGRIKFLLSVLPRLLEGNYDIYHSHSPSTHLLLPIVKLLKNTKVGITIHGAPTNMIGGGILNKTGLPKLLWKLILFYPFDFVFDVKNIGNGVNIAEYDAVKVKKDPKVFRIFWIGRRYDPVKGIKFLEQAVKEINDPKVVLDIAENVYGEEKIKRYKQADLFVLPSLSEGLPLVLLEAMAARLPIITTDVGECRKLIESAKAGFVVKPGDVKVLKTAILAMMKKSDDFGQNGYDFVKENYTWGKVSEKVAKAIGLTIIKSGTK